MKINNEDKNKHVEVILIVPLGVEESIFPWGIYSIKDYLTKTCESLMVKIWDLRKDHTFTEINKQYGKLLKKLFVSLKPDQTGPFLRLISNPFIFFGVVSCLGEKFLGLTRCKNLINSTYAQDVNNLQRKASSYLTEKINEYIKDAEGKNRIWAFSVFDYTVFNSLYIARLIKENDPGSTVVFGGDYFDFENARKIMRNIAFVDGVVVGYGEEVMRRIVIEQQERVPFQNLRIKGLVNAFVMRGGEESQMLMEVNTPPFFHDLPNNPFISYVQRAETGEIRVLTQRGCSWGNCTFCTQLDNKKFFPISTEVVLREIQAAIETTNEETIRIRIDSDDISREFFLELLKFLESYKDRNVKFNINGWFQVKSFRREMAASLEKIDHQKINLRFWMNLESLNYGTLKHMQKGHSPIQAIEAAKAVLDCGLLLGTNYFIHFPLENRENLSQEVQFLKSATHLLMPPKVGVAVFPYAANNRDQIFLNQEKYHLKITRNPGDKWLQEAFGVDLPFSIWSHSYSYKPSLAPDHLLTSSYYYALMSRNSAYLPSVFSNIHWKEIKKSLGEQITFFARVLRYFAWVFIHYSFQLFKKGSIFHQRTNLILYFSKVAYNTGNNSTTKSQFFLQNNCLTKDYHIPGNREKWSLLLNHNELNILRYLYWKRKRHEVIEKFKTVMSEPDIIKFLDRHIKLGTLVQFKDLLLCVVNDPEYWQSN